MYRAKRAGADIGIFVAAAGGHGVHNAVRLISGCEPREQTPAVMVERAE
jgi:hypothetical protein